MRNRSELSADFLNRVDNQIPLGGMSLSPYNVRLGDNSNIFTPMVIRERDTNIKGIGKNPMVETIPQLIMAHKGEEEYWVMYYVVRLADSEQFTYEAVLGLESGNTHSACFDTLPGIECRGFWRSTAAVYRSTSYAASFLRRCPASYC